MAPNPLDVWAVEHGFELREGETWDSPEINGRIAWMLFAEVQRITAEQVVRSVQEALDRGQADVIYVHAEDLSPPIAAIVRREHPDKGTTDAWEGVVEAAAHGAVHSHIEPGMF